MWVGGSLPATFGEMNWLKCGFLHQLQTFGIFSGLKCGNFTSKKLGMCAFQLGMCDDSRWSHRALEATNIGMVTMFCRRTFSKFGPTAMGKFMDSWWYRKPAREGPWGPWVVVGEIWISLFGSHAWTTVCEWTKKGCLWWMSILHLAIWWSGPSLDT